ncbi:kinase-like protein [Neolentinus lepideus HHB14362 ss-1]|uniref:Kinase-like protein n=1 Tax=Neolentinus lepideus HHB14362 ss-1 TaxID=1314782 RepID=A0A165SQP8_9AGAM|nr:kinase-like protein [Neolentinus lepideus HHB14362 ss-1]
MLSRLGSIFPHPAAATYVPLNPILCPRAIANRVRCGSTASAHAKKFKSLRWKGSPPQLCNANHGDDTLISFPEEPIGIPADHGFGHLEVYIGDKLGDRGEYNITRKLGFGRYSTVWLARQTHHMKFNIPYFTAIKVLSQYATRRLNERSDEFRILQRISNSSSSHKGKEFCATLWDSFLVDGDDDGGPHQCLVLDAMAGDVKQLRSMYRDGVMPLAMTKTIIGQMLVALQYLHEECRIVHADLRPENILIANPYPGIELKKILMGEKPTYYPPMTVLGREVQPIVSHPLLSPPRFFEFQSAEHQWMFKLGDFGGAQFINDRINDCTTPDGLRAPEVILDHPWDEKIDIWALGCLTCEFLTGRSIFDETTWSFGQDDQDLVSLALMMRCTGQQFPPDMLSNCNLEKVAQYFGPGGALADLANEDCIPSSIIEYLKEHNREIAHDSRELEAAAAFINRCLALRPGDRPSAAELLRDPWLLSQPVWSYETDPASASKEETVGAMVTILSPWGTPYLGVILYMSLLLGTAWFVWALMY